MALIDPSRQTFVQRTASFMRRILFGKHGPTQQESHDAHVAWLSEQVRIYAQNPARLTPLTHNLNLTGETPEIRQAYRQMIKEGMIKAALITKIQAVASLDLQVQPATKDDRGKAIAEWVRHAIEKSEGGTRGLIESMLFPALLEGFSISEKVWDRVGNGKYKGFWTVKRVKSKDTTYVQIQTDQYLNINGIRALGNNSGVVFDPANFIVFTHMPIFCSPLGMSDLRAAYRPYVLKEAAIKLRMIALDKFSGPWLKGRYTDAATRQALNQALAAARASGYIVLPPGAEVEVVDLAVAQVSEFKSAIDDFDKELIISIQGAFLQILEGQTTDGRGDTGVHKSTSQLIQGMLAFMAAEAINRQLVPDLCDPNFGDCDYPVVSLGGLDPAKVMAELQIDQALWAMKVPLSKQQLYDRTGREPPKDDGDTLVQADPPPPGGPPGGVPGGVFDDAAPTSTGGAVTSRAGGDAVESPATPRRVQLKPGPSAGGAQPAKTGEVALAGKDGAKVASLLKAAQASGVGTFADLSEVAVGRLLRLGPQALSQRRLFQHGELSSLADALAATNATADLLGRSRVRERAVKAEASQGLHKLGEGEQPFSAFADVAVPPMPPAEAVNYFQSLVPTLGVDPHRYGQLQQRAAFTLAVATDEVLLERVQDLIRAKLESGQEVKAGARQIQELMDAAGVSSRNPQYAEMVMRTNAMDAYNAGVQTELATPDMREAFPCWRYLGIRDGRQGKDHEPHFDRYYPADAPFDAVRGPRPFNCRCTLIPVDKWEWEELQAKGVRLSPWVARHGEDYHAFGADDWEPHVGPKGGKGWKHKQSGRIVYSATNPGGKERDGKQAPAGGKEQPAKDADDPPAAAKPAAASLVDPGTRDAVVAAMGERKERVERAKAYLARSHEEHAGAATRLAGLPPGHPDTAQAEAAVHAAAAQITEAHELVEYEHAGARRALADACKPANPATVAKPKFANRHGSQHQADVQRGHAFVASLLGDGDLATTCERTTDRAHCSGYILRTAPSDGPAVAAHEVCHAVAHQNPGVVAACVRFWESRCGSEADTNLREKFPNYDYEATEHGRADDFGKAVGDPSHAYYAGKVYRDAAGKITDTEVLTMGVELLYSDPVGFVERDPEWAAFVVGVLNGKVRG